MWSADDVPPVSREAQNRPHPEQNRSLQHQQQPPGGNPMKQGAPHLYSSIQVWIIVLMLTVLCQLTHSSCPEQCRCTGQSPMLSATCSAANITAEQLDGVAMLYLAGTNLTDIATLQLENVPLSVLDLSDNRITNEPCSRSTSTPSTVQLNTPNTTLDLSSVGVTPAMQPCLSSLLPSTLHHLSLHHNSLRCVNITCLAPHGITTLDISHNMASDMIPAQLPALQDFNISGNSFTKLPADLLEHFPHLITLDVSNNQVTSLWSDAITVVAEDVQHGRSQTNDSYGAYSSLQYLNVHNNNISILNSGWFNKIPLVRHIILSQNSLVFIPAKVFSNCSMLLELDLSHMSTLQYIDAETFYGLHRLQTLLLSHNSQLTYIHSGVLQYLQNLQVLDLSFNSLKTLHVELLMPIVSIQQINVRGNQWNCDCDVLWIQQLTAASNVTSAIEQSNTNITVEQWQRLSTVLMPSDMICSSPEQYGNLTLSDIRIYNHSCSNVTMASTKQRTQFHIGSAATLNCDIDGDPTPFITWVTPSGSVIEQDPAFISLHHTPNVDSSIHNQHDHRDRIHILHNGSLYIDYVKRKDVGHYDCTAHNPHGNITIRVPLRLDAIFRHKVNISFAVGLCSAIVFMFIGIIVAVLRYVAFKCSREQREKRKSIRQILAGMSEYRSEKYDRFSAYRIAKIDQLSAFKSANVSKLKNAKNLTVTTLINYLHQTQENYTANIQHIRDNCTQQATHLRENYVNQLGKIRGYKTDKIVRIRDNYQAQANRIKDYGSSQLEKLRDQYHLQQQHALKILEIMNIGNCMNVIESECMKTESLIFDDELFDMDRVYDKCPFTHVQMLYTSDSHSNVSNYQTAGTGSEDDKINIDNKKDTEQQKGVSADKTVINIPNIIKKRVRQKQNGGQVVDLEGGESPMFPPRKPHQRKKKRLHKKRTGNPDTPSHVCNAVLNRDDSIHYLGDTEDVQPDSNNDSPVKRISISKNSSEEDGHHPQQEQVPQECGSPKLHAPDDYTVVKPCDIKGDTQGGTVQYVNSQGDVEGDTGHCEGVELPDSSTPNSQVKGKPLTESYV